MEQFLMSLPNTFIGWISTIFLIIGSFSFYWRYRRNEDLKLLRDTNKDQGDRIEVLETKSRDQDNNIVLLQAQVKLLETQNKTLEDLMVIALKQYFFEHPDVASRMQEKILK